ncbi:MAG: HAD family phosphatase [Williamsia sp.]|nr:HAD family phosphatase [Williamsia sp.]
MKRTVAFLFDMDGTLADNMQYHLQAWEKVVSGAGSDLKGEALMNQLYGKNSEVIERIFGKERFSKEEVKDMSLQKERHYHALYAQHVKLLPGLKGFLEEARSQGVKIAIATAGLGMNVDFLLEHTQTRGLFDAFISDEDVRRSKPDPETFILAAGKLEASPSACIVFEDSPKGVEAAQQANMKAVAVLTAKEEADFARFPNVIKTISNYKNLSVQELLDAIEQPQEQQK